MNILLIPISTIGLFISIYFALVYRNIIRPDTTWIPTFCRIDEQSCGSILRTPEAKIIRIPNFYLGIGYYVALIVLSFFPSIMQDFLFELRMLSGFTVFVGIVLTYSLIWRIKISCVLCFTSHAINLILFLVLLAWP
ncbi:MAG: vitamin K epoxide reductase family protein [Bacteroidota bacterium]